MSKDVDAQVKGGMEDPDYHTQQHEIAERVMSDMSDDKGQIPVYDQKSFDRGGGVWRGVVLITRPASPSRDSLCKVMSARTVEYNGMRAIAPFEVPYGMVSHLFEVEDGADTYAYGEFFPRPGNLPGHFEFYERASQKEFFLTAGGNLRLLYPHDTKSQPQ